MKKPLLPILLLSSLPVMGQIYKDAQAPVEARVADLLGRMTLDEKIAQIRHLHSGQLFAGQTLDAAKLASASGGMSWGFVEAFPLSGDSCAVAMEAIQRYMVEETRLGIPVFTVAESLHGAVHDGATIFPQNIAMGSTFSPELAYAKATLTARDLHAMGYRQVLAPCIDVVRDLRWGRVEESYGEDPYLCGLMGLAEVRGYQDAGIAPMLKHFGPHGNPLGGLNLASVECGARDLREVYLLPFEMIVRQTPVMAVMSTYNSWNRIPNSASHLLLTDILRREWGFRGYVYSDWGAISMLRTFHRSARTSAEAALQAITAGLDAEASSDCYPLLPQLIAAGELSEAVVDTAVSRVLRAKFEAGLFDDPYGRAWACSERHSAESVALSKRIATESIVLLKNEGSLLPLDRSKLRSVAVIGPNADQVQFGDYSWTRSNRDGITPLAAIRRLAGSDLTVRYAQGCSLTSQDTTGLQAAVETARASDVAIIFGGSASASLARDYKSSTCGEGFDLHDLSLTGGQTALIEAVRQTGVPVVLVLVTGKPFAIERESEQLPAILMQWYGGERQGEAIAEILFGEASPSGRLTFSIPRSVGHLPVYYNHLPSDRGLYHNHGSLTNPGRDYVFSAPTPLYSFGHGLTYTSFAYGRTDAPRTAYAPAADTVRLSVELVNTGLRAGQEVVQLYSVDRATCSVTPVRQLRAFRKVMLQPGERQRVELSFPVEALRVCDAEGQWQPVSEGEYLLEAGSSSDNIRITQPITVGTPHVVGEVAAVAKAARQSTRTVELSGEVRDVQATLLPGVALTDASGRQLGVTDAAGRYRVSIGNHDIITFSKQGYEPVSLEPEGRATVNVRMNVGL